MQELVRILKEEYGFFDKGLDELLEMIIETREHELVEEIKRLSNAKGVIPKIVHDIEQHRDFDGFEDEIDQTKNIEDVISLALVGYDYTKIIPELKKDYRKVVQEITKYKDMDFVAHYKTTLFEPSDLNQWKRLLPSEESFLVLYAKDLKKTERTLGALRTLAKLIGEELEQEPRLYADYDSRMYTIHCTYGLHARNASSLVHTTHTVELDIRIGRYRSLREHYINGKSIIGLLTLGAHKGVILEFLCKGNDSEIERFYERLELMRDITEKGDELVFQRYRFR